MKAAEKKAKILIFGVFNLSFGVSRLQYQLSHPVSKGRKIDLEKCLEHPVV